MAETHNSLLSRWSIALAFIVLIPCLVGIYIVDQNRRSSDEKARAALASAQAKDSWARYDSAYESCIRGNTLRATANEHVVAIRNISVVLDSFLESSAAFRSDAGRPGLAQEARAAQIELSTIASRLDQIPEVICEDVIEKPLVPRPGLRN